MELTEQQSKNFWRRVKKTETCWLWTGYNTRKGYGRMEIKGKCEFVHRISYLIHRETIPKGKQINHTCDVRNCVNPEHLYAGTQKENIRDMLDRGRHHKVILTYLDIKEILELDKKGISKKNIANQYKTKENTISHLIRGVSWGHLTGIEYRRQYLKPVDVVFIVMFIRKKKTQRSALPAQ